MLDTDIKINELIKAIEGSIVGKREVIELIITALLAKGHVLVEDVPGVGKTKLVSSMAKACNGEYHRLQMTPDIMPSDITGFTLIKQSTGEQEFHKGAAFCNFLLADEINRSSPKSQSALLEIMEERQVSHDGMTYELPSVFMVLATQNPVETYGTYHLPEAQMDRFLMKLSMGYPSREDEISILRRNNSEPVCDAVSLEDIEELIGATKEVFVSDAISEYIVRIANATRESEAIRLGVSPRGSIALFEAAKAYALVKGEKFVDPDMIKYLAPYVLAHRIMLSSSRSTVLSTNEDAIRMILDQVEVPV